MTHTHHAIDYVEISVADLAARQARSTAPAFGWQFNDYGPDVRRHPRARRRGRGRRPQRRPRRRAGRRRSSLLYSDDLDATVAAVEAAGGAVVEGPYDFPGGRRFTSATPSGNVLGVWSDQPSRGGAGQTECRPHLAASRRRPAPAGRRGRAGSSAAAARRPRRR